MGSAGAPSCACSRSSASNSAPLASGKWQVQGKMKKTKQKGRVRGVGERVDDRKCKRVDGG